MVTRQSTGNQIGEFFPGKNNRAKGLRSHTIVQSNQKRRSAMNRRLRTPLASPVLLGSALSLLSVLPASAAIEIFVPEPETSSCEAFSQEKRTPACQRTNPAGTTDRSVRQNDQGNSVPSGEIEDLAVTEEESDAAVARFGCDCPPCITALRQLRHPSLLR